MDRTTLPTCCCLLLGAAALVLVGACGQNEGGRCQVTSDCASGLTCFGGDTGNGKCQRSPVGPPGNDAASTEDAPEDLTSIAAPEAGPDVAEVEPVDVEPDSAVADVAASESGTIDTIEID
jgi:hypothetical protein